MQNAAKIYGKIALQTASPRELEAGLLLKAASRLQASAVKSLVTCASLSASTARIAAAPHASDRANERIASSISRPLTLARLV